ncbi:MAG TPA: hypothetical protein VM779_07820 [Thermoanaerobaculia bacterium]|nr:hypothetical protein [Thermoanaerobaculia bacterium]
MRGRIRDKDGGVGDATTTVTVLSPGEAMDAIAAMIAALRAGGSLNKGQANALLVKLEHALRHLEVLLKQVETFGRTGVLTAAESAELAFWIEQLMLSIRASG